jgi:hypothetical protein
MPVPKGLRASFIHLHLFLYHTAELDANSDTVGYSKL